MTQLPDGAVDVKNLTKIYGRGDGARSALDTISLTVPRGSFFALLGPNGAGKSTFINILAGLVNKTSGEVRIWGHDILTEERLARSSIGIVPQELNLDAFFTPRQALELQAGFYGVPKSERRTDELLNAVGLTDKADSFSRSLSGGMQRRLLIAKAMAHSPPVLILDEPTAGVDIQLRQRLWSYVQELNDSGVTVLLTTHYLEEAQALCDTVAIINKGRVIACEDKSSLLKRLDHKTLTLSLNTALSDIPPQLAAYAPQLASPHSLMLHYKTGNVEIAEILEAVQAAGLHFTDLSTQEADLEDIFLMLTKDGEMG